MKTYQVLGSMAQGQKILSGGSVITVKNSICVAHSPEEEAMIESSSEFQSGDIFEVDPAQTSRETLQEAYTSKMRTYNSLIPDELMNRLSKIAPEGRKKLLQACEEIADFYEVKKEIPQAITTPPAGGLYLTPEMLTGDAKLNQGMAGDLAKKEVETQTGKETETETEIKTAETTEEETISAEKVNELNDKLEALTKEDDILQVEFKTAKGPTKGKITVRLKEIESEMREILDQLPKQ